MVHTKLVKDLQPGDRLVALDGRIVTVTSLHRGMGDKLKIIKHDPGDNFTQMPWDSTVQLADGRGE